MRLFVTVFAALALTACAATTAVTGMNKPGQALYGAVGFYASSARAARVYAQTPTADPAIVKAIDKIDKSRVVEESLTFARNYWTCTSPRRAELPATVCLTLDYGSAEAVAATIRKQAEALVQSRLQGEALAGTPKGN